MLEALAEEVKEHQKMIKHVMLRHIIVFLLLVDFAFAGTIGQNLLKNPSFEDDLTAWVLEDGTCCQRGAYFTWAINTKNAHHRKQALKVIGYLSTCCGFHAKVKQATTEMIPNKRYTMRFWAFAESPRIVFLTIYGKQDPWKIYYEEAISLIGQKWKVYQTTFTFHEGAFAKRDAREGIWVAISMGNSEVDFYLDDFRFFEGEPEDNLALRVDINGDGTINILDLVLISQYL